MTKYCQFLCYSPLLFLLFELPFSSCAGTFKVKLKKYSNPENLLSSGFCCSSRNKTSVCDAFCDFTLSVCLQTYKELDKTFELDINSCPLGSSSTQMKSSIQSAAQNGYPTLEIPFSWVWLTSVTVIVEMRSGRDLIIRTVESLKLKPISFEEVPRNLLHSQNVKSSEVSIAYEVSVSCDEHTYGEGCNVTCTPQDNQRGHYSCNPAGTRVCYQGWMGKQCDKPRCENSCGNGTCFAPNQCRCDYGWQGEKCDACVPYEGCVNGYCNQPFQCNCHHRWGGLVCDLDLDMCLSTKPCKNGATCHPHSPGNYSCQCMQGFEGRDCENRKSPCSSNPCLHGGTCAVTESSPGYKCNCGTLATGQNCELSLLESPPKQIKTTDITFDVHESSNKHGDCFYMGHLYSSGSQWETADCRQCSCISTKVECTMATCYSKDCLATPDICPRGQSCRSITQSTCLKHPCRKLIGQCIPTDIPLIPDQSMAICRTTMDMRINSHKCTRIFVKLDPKLLHEDTSVEKLCFDILLVLLTRGLNHFAPSCKVVNAQQLIVRIDVYTTRVHTTTDRLQGVLMSILTERISNSPILNSITDTNKIYRHSIINNKQHQMSNVNYQPHFQSNKQGNKKESNKKNSSKSMSTSSLVIMVLIGALLLCIIALCLVAYLFYRRLQQINTRINKQRPRIGDSVPPTPLEKCAPLQGGAKFFPAGPKPSTPVAKVAPTIILNQAILNNKLNNWKENQFKENKKDKDVNLFLEEREDKFDNELFKATAVVNPLKLSQPPKKRRRDIVESTEISL